MLQGCIKSQTVPMVSDEAVEIWALGTTHPNYRSQMKERT